MELQQSHFKQLFLYKSKQILSLEEVIRKINTAIAVERNATKKTIEAECHRALIDNKMKRGGVRGSREKPRQIMPTERQISPQKSPIRKKQPEIQIKALKSQQSELDNQPNLVSKKKSVSIKQESEHS